jgi:hypothetical protein
MIDVNKRHPFWMQVFIGVIAFCGLTASVILCAILREGVNTHDTLLIIKSDVAEIKAKEPIGRKEFDNLKAEEDSFKQAVVDWAQSPIDGHIPHEQIKRVKTSKIP